MSKDNWTFVGTIGIDSGSLIIIDPCYIDKDFNKKNLAKMIKNGLVLKSTTGIGDGAYPVYANIKNDPVFGRRVHQLLVDFMPEEWSK